MSRDERAEVERLQAEIRRLCMLLAWDDGRAHYGRLAQALGYSGNSDADIDAWRATVKAIHGEIATAVARGVEYAKEGRR